MVLVDVFQAYPAIPELPQEGRAESGETNKGKAKGDGTYAPLPQIPLGRISSERRRTKGTRLASK